MKSTLFKLLPIATAVVGLSFSYGAFAWDSTGGGGGGGGTGSDDTQNETTTTTNKDTTSLSNTKSFSDTLTTTINVNAGKGIPVTSQATALVNSSQEIEDATIGASAASSQSDIGDDRNGSMQNIVGMAQSNVGSGNLGNQDNEIAFSTNGNGSGSVDAEEFNAQKIESDASSRLPLYSAGSSDSLSFVKSGSMDNLLGMAQANDGSGSAYNQSNGLAAAVESSALSATATGNSNQELEDVSISSDLATSQSGILDSLNAASGLAQLNVGSGIGYNQHNSMAVTLIPR